MASNGGIPQGDRTGGQCHVTVDDDEGASPKVQTLEDIVNSIKLADQAGRKFLKKGMDNPFCIYIRGHPFSMYARGGGVGVPKMRTIAY